MSAPSVTVSIDRDKAIGIGGAAVMLLGTLLPAATIPMVGSIAMASTAWGWWVMGAAAACGVGAALGSSRALGYSGAVATGILVIKFLSLRATDEGAEMLLGAAWPVVTIGIIAVGVAAHLMGKAAAQRDKAERLRLADAARRAEQRRKDELRAKLQARREQQQS